MRKAWLHTSVGLLGAFAIAWWFHSKQKRATGLAPLEPSPAPIQDSSLPPELLVDPLQRAISPIYNAQAVYAGMDGFGITQDELMENANKLMKQAQEMMESL